MPCGNSWGEMESRLIHDRRGPRTGGGGEPGDLLQAAVPPSEGARPASVKWPRASVEGGPAPLRRVRDGAGTPPRIPVERA